MTVVLFVQNGIIKPKTQKTEQSTGTKRDVIVSKLYFYHSYHMVRFF